MLNIPGYEVIEQIYESSNSLVYRGVRESDGERIVIKMLKDAYPSPERIVGFKREYEILKKLNLPGVVKAYEVLSIDNRPLLVLEDFGGVDLVKLKLAGKLELSEWLKIAIAVAEILGQIHNEGIIHKDLNPSNILLEPKSGRIKIIDFGIATARSREMPDLENPNFIEGTLAYISPEQTGRMNRAIDYRSDYYSLGVTLYELLVGKRPFESEDILELIHAHIAKEAILPRELTDRFDATSLETVSEIVMKLMAKNAEDRYRSVGGLQADLKECLGRLERWGKIERFSLGRSDVADRLEIPQKLYGRDRETQQLLNACERIASSHQKEIFLVEGEAGVGKSALVKEVEKVVLAGGGNFLSGRCDREAQNPYSAISEAFNKWCDRLLGETDCTLKLWREKILAAVDKNAQVLIEIIPNLEKVLGKQPSVPLLGLIGAQNRFNLVLDRFFRVICQPEHPLILFIDDLQWADERLWKVLRKTLGNPELKNLLIIGAYRPKEVDRDSPMARALKQIEKASGALSFLKLDNLMKAEVNTLVAKAIACPPEACWQLTEVVCDRTGGNAFLTVEFLKEIYHKRLLNFDRQEQKWLVDIEKIKTFQQANSTVEFIAKTQKNWQQASDLKEIIESNNNLLKAEKMRKKGKRWEAARFYEEAIKEAKNREKTIDQALSYELAGEFYLENEMAEIAQTYLSKARSAYYGSQNTEKVKDLETKHPHLFLEKLSERQLNSGYKNLQTTTTNPSNNTDTASLDLSSILKASQTLAGEIILESLLGKMMKIVIENAGAEKGFLIMEKEAGKWKVEAAAIASENVEVLQSIPIETVSGESEKPMVSNSIVNYVIRTQKNVVLNDAVREGNFTNTPYILKQKPKSVLCAPVQNQGKLVGILYLENNLVAGAFTSDKIKLLNMLASPAAVAIENAKLFARTLTSESKLTQILEALPVGVMLVEGKGNVSYLNQTAKKLLGAEKAEVTVAEMSSVYQLYVAESDRLYPSDRLPPVKAQRGEELIVEELEIRREEQVIPIEMRSTPVIDARGSVIYTINVFADIGERKRAQKVLANYSRTLEKQVAERTTALQESEQRFRNAFEMATVGMCQISPEGKFLAVNPSLCQTLGYSKSELLKLKVTAITHPEDREKDRSDYQQLLAGEIPYYHFQKRYLHEKGQTIWAEVGVSLVRDRDGEPLYTIAQIQDITERKKAMEALAESEERYRRIVETSNEGIWAIDKFGNTTFVNPKMAEMLGYTIGEMIGKSMFDFMDYEGRAIAVDYVKKNEDEVSQKQDFKFRRKDGSSMWAIFSMAGIFDEEGEYRGALGTIADITERKRAEKKIAFQAFLLDRVRNAAIATDLEGRVIYLNQFARSLYQLTPETAIGKNIFELTVPPTEQINAREIIASIEEKGYWEGEFTVRRQDGSTFCAYVINTLLKDLDGNAIGFVGVSTDISEWKQAQEALRKSEQRYELATRAAKVGVWEWNLETGELYLDANIKAIIGYRDEEIENNLESWVKYIWEGDRDRVMKVAVDHLEGKTPEYVCEHRMIHKDGSLRWILVRGKAIRNSEGKAIALIGTDTDISDRKLAEEATLAAKEAAEAANKTKSAFLANMSHELRSPLNAINGFAQIMLRSPNLSSEHQQYLGIVYRSGEHLLALINDVLDMAKIEAGRATLNETAFDLHAFLHDLEETFRLKAKEKGLQSIFDRHPNLPRYVKCDRIKLRQVLINLLNNAFKFTKEGGVSLRAKMETRETRDNSPITHYPFPIPHSQNSKIYLEIEDSGPGIAAEELDKIFEPFVQTETGREAQEGTGLGLSISKSYVELMGGNIWASSEVNRGTCFKFEIKIEIVEAAEVENREAPRRIIALQPNQPQYRILIVDDKWTNRRLLVRLLSPLGFQILEASNGMEAFQAWDAWQPHLIFMDLRMPVMDGYEATKTIKTSTEDRSTAIIALTASSFDEERDLATAAGCDDFIRKPFREAEIFDTIEKHLGVRYVCEEPSNSPSAEVQFQETLTPELLGAFSAPILANLERETIRINLEGIYNVIEEIRRTHPDVADSLTRWVDNFEYTKILNLIKLAKKKHD